MVSRFEPCCPFYGFALDVQAQTKYWQILAYRKYHDRPSQGTSSSSHRACPAMHDQWCALASQLVFRN